MSIQSTSSQPPIKLGTFQEVDYYYVKEVEGRISPDCLTRCMTMAQLPSEKPLKFHYVRNEEHFLGRITVKKVHNKAIYIIENVELFSHGQTRERFVGVPSSTEGFIKGLKRYPLIKEDLPLPVEDQKNDLFLRQIPEEIVLHNKSKMYFSAEMKENLSGQRGMDHLISLSHFEKCVNKLCNNKKDKLSKMRLNLNTPFFFRSSDSVDQFLILIFRKDLDSTGKPFFTAHSGYYAKTNNLRVLEATRKLSPSEFDAWRKQLPTFD